ncbi:MAG: hypothetical protein WA055_03775 [Candidatus Moraniibacteriota bacterium]
MLNKKKIAVIFIVILLVVGFVFWIFYKKETTAISIDCENHDYIDYLANISEANRLMIAGNDSFDKVITMIIKNNYNDISNLRVETDQMVVSYNKSKEKINDFQPPEFLRNYDQKFNKSIDQYILASEKLKDYISSGNHSNSELKEYFSREIDPLLDDKLLVEQQESLKDIEKWVSAFKSKCINR